MGVKLLLATTVRDVSERRHFPVCPRLESCGVCEHGPDSRERTRQDSWRCPTGWQAILDLMDFPTLLCASHDKQCRTAFSLKGLEILGGSWWAEKLPNDRKRQPCSRPPPPLLETGVGQDRAGCVRAVVFCSNRAWICARHIPSVLLPRYLRLKAWTEWTVQRSGGRSLRIFWIGWQGIMASNAANPEPKAWSHDPWGTLTGQNFRTSLSSR